MCWRARSARFKQNPNPAKLVQIREQTYLWARQYDRELTNLLGLQGEIANEIADEIQFAWGRTKRVDRTRSAYALSQGDEAYDLYLKGRYFWNKRTPQALQQAIDCFQKASEKDASDARTYAGLADAYALFSGYSLAPAKEIMPKARAAAVRALQIDEKSGGGPHLVGGDRADYDWDWKAPRRNIAGPSS